MTTADLLWQPVFVDEQILGAIDVDKHGDDVMHALGPGCLLEVRVDGLRLPALVLLHCEGVCLVFLVIVVLQACAMLTLPQLGSANLESKDYIRP